MTFQVSEVTLAGQKTMWEKSEPGEAFGKLSAHRDTEVFQQATWVCLKMVSTPKPNGFHDHYPVFKWLFHWEYTLFSDKPTFECHGTPN